MFELTGKKGLVLGIANENSIAYGCAAFLASDEAKSLTGNTEHIDGGIHILH